MQLAQHAGPATATQPGVASRMTFSTAMARPAGRFRNLLLDSLTEVEAAQLMPHLEKVELEQRDVLFEAGARIPHVFFPATAVVSLVSRFDRGSVVEVGTVGCEGIAGLPVFLGDDVGSMQALVQIGGGAYRMEADAFRELAESAEFNRLLLRYTQAFLTQVAQTAACNGAHFVEERCARWLLVTHDRVEGDQFALTHEFLAFMLGVRRAGVTMAMRRLKEEGLVAYTRGSISILNRGGLERASCECYAATRAHFERLLSLHSFA